ncbi:hypothetical protein AB1Y20_008710 [Prymnesium parvum]|uniref:Secreted protein n=1 Tax=Prymnesium parvum TaxID=97485 RepID=A0AB34IU88_PRYPA
MAASRKTWRPAMVLFTASVSLWHTQTVASTDDGFGEVCACARDAECGAFRALSDEQRRARAFPLNPAFAVGETPAVYAAHSQQLTLAEVCPQIWPPPSHSTYWSKRKDKVRHTMQFYNQLANGQTFGLFENKLLMKRVYRCLDIPFMVPYFSAMVAQRPRVQPDRVEAPNKYRQDSRINRETELLKIRLPPQQKAAEFL